MEKFTRSERIFLIFATVTAIAFLVISRFQFISLEQGATFTPAVPITLMWASIAAIVWLAYITIHRLVRS